MKTLATHVSPSASVPTIDLYNMANRSYLPTHHRLLAGFSPLTSSHSSAVVGVGRSSSPPEFSYDAYRRESAARSGSSAAASAGSSGGDGGGGSVRDMSGYGRTPTSPGSSSLSMAYPSVQEFPYGLSGVQMPTYNFGSELYNYVSNGFPRKSRMCSYCNKVFTRSTTRRYHEKRCPLLRASNSLAKNEENNAAAVTSALSIGVKDQHRHHQSQKESPGGLSSSKPSPLLPRTLSSSITNTTSAQAGSIPLASPPLPSLHPAYPTSFPTSSALASSASRAASLYNGYPHSYRSHFYNSISAAALASLDQNGTSNNIKQDLDTVSWESNSPPPNSGTGKGNRDDKSDRIRARHSSDSGGGGMGGLNTNTLGLNLSSSIPPPLTKVFSSDSSAMDLTARYCADFTIRTRPPVFPATSLRAQPPSPPSPDIDDCKSVARSGENADRSSCSSPDVVVMNAYSKWPNQNQDRIQSQHYDQHLQHHAPPPPDSPPNSEIRIRSSSPPTHEGWDKKSNDGVIQGPYMQVAPLDEEDEDDLDEDEDEEEVAEDEEQFKSSPLNSEEDADGTVTLRQKSSTYDPMACHYCKKVFTDVVTRKAHEALHTQRKSFACSLCDNSFHCAYSLRIHTLRHHKSGPYKCKYCMNTYDTAFILKSHLVKEHSLPQSEKQSVKYVGLLTGNSSPPLDSMMLNTAVSDSEQDQDRYITRLLPYQHRRSADNLPRDPPFPESADAKRRSASNEFNTSSRSRTSAMTSTSGASIVSGDLATETCKICNKSFAKSFIRFHERAHADQKPYECPICNKRFGYKNNMKSHMKLHQGLKPYQCQICGARFTRGSTLRRHGRRHNISRNSMLDYVLYDHSAGPSRAMGVAQKVNMTSTNVSTPVKGSLYSRSLQAISSESQEKSLLSSMTHSSIAASGGYDSARFNATNLKSSPPGLSPSAQHGSSPRGGGNPLASQTMANSMVGGMAAVAAANLFAYPGAAAAPHLYQFYASTNPLIGYPSYPGAAAVAASNQNGPIVQSDALNLSLGKRKSPFTEEEDKKDGITDAKKCMNDIAPRRNSIDVPPREDSGHLRHPVRCSIDEAKMTKIKVESGECEKIVVPKRELCNPFTPITNTKDHSALTTESETMMRESKYHPTEDFGAQVNICCPSPPDLLSAANQTSAGPLSDKADGDDANTRSNVSPRSLCQTASPTNSVSSPVDMSNESQFQNLLLSLITSGRLFRCSFCDIYFAEYAMFRLHQKYHQSDIARPFLCAVCGEDCKDKTYFTVHLSEHLGLGPKAVLT